MAALSGPVWVVLAVIAVVTAMAILQVLASAVGRDTFVHDLRVRVAQLRAEQMERLRRLAENGHVYHDAPPTTPQEADDRRAAA
ncbi:MAG: hypothetical protein HBSAPP03_16460 [Phycisphaerae bacterium]|nr:MAG: hypothetical protein HBSAPP03_16460 [Phycisphaerae bacterium]